MTTKIIMVRHGFSEANDKSVYAGSMDYPLSELGLKQAQLCGKEFEQSDISALYSSNLKRAYDTALPISKATGLEIIVDKELRECDGGDWEGMSYDDLCNCYPVEYGIWMNDIGNAKCPGGETIEEFADRILSAVTRIAKKHEGKIVCIATHATPIRVITTVANKLSILDMKNIPWCANASINTFEYENGEFSIVELNNDRYLGELHSVLPPNV